MENTPGYAFEVSEPKPLEGSPGARGPRLALLLLSCVLAIAILVGAFHLLGATPAIAGPAGALIGFSPAAGTVHACEQITVEVRISDVVDLYGADVRISFDPDLLTVVDAYPAINGIQIQHGNLLSPDYVVYNTANNTTGDIKYAFTQLNPSPAVTGTGVLARIFFKAKGEGASALDFYYTMLGTRNGVEIPSTTLDGSLSADPPLSSTLTITRANSTDVRLSWGAAPGASAYHLYRSSDPFFTPDGSPHLVTTSLEYVDQAVLGSPTQHHFYLLRAACANGFEGLESNRVGEFEYPLRAVSSTNLSDAALILHMPELSDAAALATYVGESVLEVQRFDPATQTFRVYAAEHPETNYSLHLGDVLFLLTDSNAPPTLALVGEVPAPGSLVYAPTPGPQPRYYFQALPLEGGAVSSAAQLPLPSGISQAHIIRYLIETQTFQLYAPGDLATDFPLSIGEPYAWFFGAVVP